MFQDQRCRQPHNETKHECADAQPHPTEAGQRTVIFSKIHVSERRRRIIENAPA
jgi:hypothetical protein